MDTPLTLAEQFLLLIHHPEKARYLVADYSRDSGLIGAVLLDLVQEEKLLLQDGKLEVVDSSTSLTEVHAWVLSQIAHSKKIRKVKHWISRLSRKVQKYRYALLDLLQSKGILKVEHKKFLFIPYLRTYLLEQQSRGSLIQRLRSVVLEEETATMADSSLLGLLEACKIYKILAHDKQEIKQVKKRLKVLKQETPISGEVDQVIRETQAALIATLAASTAVTAATTASSH